ncbi:MAG TPA: hypothetical protein VFQ58_05730 [Flavisolibacter sp.]|jgi:hypothetical protein|nr:hypothetical protein [Flavisolibacter sp.]
MNSWNIQESKKGIAIFLIALLATFLPVIFIEHSVLKYTSGIFMYPLDDTFIHMKMADNLAFNHTWGINPGQFGSASSSILYTIILAFCFRLFSSIIIIPFIINCIAALLLLFFIQRWLILHGMNYFKIILAMLFVIYLTPLPILIISGMEHMLQCLFSVLFIFSFSEWIQKLQLEGKGKSIPPSIYIYGILTAAIRYEGIFIIAIACLILVFNKKLLHAILLGFVCMLPLLVFGIYSIHRGSYFLPNSVLVKSETIPTGLSGLIHFISNILVEKLTLSRAGIAALATQRLLFILPLALIVFKQQIKGNTSYLYVLVFYFGATLFHLSLASTGWFYRYEAYLIAGGVLISSYLLFLYGDKIWTQQPILMRIVMTIVLIYLIFPIVLRSTAAFSKARQACINIYEQQYQMAEFSRKYYNNNIIAANDIGAVSYFSGARILDLWGLASIEVAKSKKKNYWTPDFLDRLVHQNNADVIMVYDSWFSDSLLKRWNKVATWKIQNNVVCGDSIVSFYATNIYKANNLKNNLIMYQKDLPSKVVVSYNQ